MTHEHFQHQRDFHYEDPAKLAEQERKAARDQALDQRSDANDEAFEQQQLQNELFFEAVQESVIMEECDEIVAEYYEEKREEQEAEIRRELAAEQHHGQKEVVLHIADRCSALNNIKSDIMLVAGVPQQVMEQLFKIFKASQDELLAEGITLEQRSKTDMLITFPSQQVALNFLKFLNQIQQGVAPDVHNKHLCTPYFGLTLIAEMGKAIANDVSELAEKLNPFKMRLDYL